MLIFKWIWINTSKVCNVMHFPWLLHIHMTDFLSPRGLLKETTIIFTDRQQISEQTKVRLWTHISYFPVKHTFNFICLFHTREREKKTLLQLIPKFHAICLLDTNQKVKIYIMDDMDAVNLLAHIFWAHTEHINILCPLRHKGRQTRLSDMPACWSHHHWTVCSRHGAQS